MKNLGFFGQNRPDGTIIIPTHAECTLSALFYIARKVVDLFFFYFYFIYNGIAMVKYAI